MDGAASCSSGDTVITQQWLRLRRFAADTYSPHRVISFASKKRPANSGLSSRLAGPRVNDAS